MDEKYIDNLTCEIEGETAVFICLAFENAFSNSELVIRKMTEELIKIAKLTDCIKTNTQLIQLWFCNSDVALFLKNGGISDVTTANNNANYPLNHIDGANLSFALTLILSDLQSNKVNLECIKNAIQINPDQCEHITKLVLECFRLLYVSLPKNETQLQVNYPSELLECYFELNRSFDFWSKIDTNKEKINLFANKRGGNNKRIKGTVDNIIWHDLRMQAIYNVIQNHVNNKYTLDEHSLVLTAWRLEFEECRKTGSDFYKIGRIKYTYKNFDDYISTLQSRRQLTNNKEYKAISRYVRYALQVHSRWDINKMKKQDFIVATMSYDSNFILEDDGSIKPPGVAMTNETAQIMINDKWIDISLQHTMPELKHFFEEALKVALDNPKEKTGLQDDGVE